MAYTKFFKKPQFFLGFFNIILYAPWQVFRMKIAFSFKKNNLIIDFGLRRQKNTKTHEKAPKNLAKTIPNPPQTSLGPALAPFKRSPNPPRRTQMALRRLQNPSRRSQNASKTQFGGSKACPKRPKPVPDSPKPSQKRFQRPPGPPKNHSPKQFKLKISSTKTVDLWN